MSDLDPRTRQAIAEGEAAWLKITSGNWDESAWRITGTALILLRTEVLHDLGTKGNVARGSIYNSAFARRLDGTAFKSMDASTRSNLLFVMEPPNRVVLDRLMADWSPDQRARRTHPATLARAIRTALRPPAPERKQANPNADVHAELARERLRREAAEERITELQRKGKDGEIDSDALYATLPKTVQERMHAWQRQRMREMTAIVDANVMEKAFEWLNATGLPLWKQYVDDAKKIYDQRRGLPLNRAQFIQIRAALNSASRKSITDKKLDEAFIAFTALEKFVLDEKDSPTQAPTLPETIGEWKRHVKTRPPKPEPGTHRRLG